MRTEASQDCFSDVKSKIGISRNALSKWKVFRAYTEMHRIGTLWKKSLSVSDLSTSNVKALRLRLGSLAPKEQELIQYMVQRPSYLVKKMDDELEEILTAKGYQRLFNTPLKSRNSLRNFSLTGAKDFSFFYYTYTPQNSSEWVTVQSPRIAARSWVTLLDPFKPFSNEKHLFYQDLRSISSQKDTSSWTVHYPQTEVTVKRSIHDCIFFGDDIQTGISLNLIEEFRHMYATETDRHRAIDACLSNIEDLESLLRTLYSIEIKVPNGVEYPEFASERVEVLP
jgi:hypothetical protein